MTVVALVLLPVVIAYTAWTYYVFRRRLNDKDFVSAQKRSSHDHVH
jgi:cytochrome bd-type quinol oxidase subunit 2